jgi:hypothetical protein
MQDPRVDDPAWKTSALPAPDDERRDCFRIDDRLLLEYWLEGESGPESFLDDRDAKEEAIRALMSQIDMKLEQACHTATQEASTEARLLAQLKKIDWALEMILTALARICPEAIKLPRLAHVNISGSGICFEALRTFQVGDCLNLRLILPPFVPLLLKAEVVRVQPCGEDQPGCLVAARFLAISHDDREALIRHIFGVHAKRLRARQMTSGI